MEERGRGAEEREERGTGKGGGGKGGEGGDTRSELRMWGEGHMVVA